MTPWGWGYNAALVGLDRGLLSRLDPGRPPELSPRMRTQVEEYYAGDRPVLREHLANWSVEVPWL
jgi:hypothetical protein